MAQRISQLPDNSIPYVQESLPFSALQRGQGNMIQPNIGIKNAEDGGNFSKPYMNAQKQTNMDLTMQAARVNGQTSIPQTIVAAQGKARNMINEASNQETDEKRYLNSYLANVIDSQPTGGKSIAILNEVMEGPNKEEFENHIRKSVLSS